MKYNHELIGNLRTMCDAPLCTDDNDRLYPAVAAGDAEAREKMIVNNMPLVIALVESHLSAFPAFEHLRDDLTAAGFLGLTAAANNLASAKRRVSNPTSYLSRSVRYHIYRTAKPPRHQTCGKDMSRRMFGARSENPSSIDARDFIESCCASELDRLLVSHREAGRTFAEIANIENISQTTVRRMFRAIGNRVYAKRRELQP